jgi:hypothetical protein
VTDWISELREMDGRFNMDIEHPALARLWPLLCAVVKAADRVRNEQPRGDFTLHSLHQALEDLRAEVDR